MTVAILAQQHRKSVNTGVLAFGLALLIVVGGWTTARGVQVDIAEQVRSAIGTTSTPSAISVDGRDVVIRTSTAISAAQQEAIAAISGIGNVMIDVTP